MPSAIEQVIEQLEQDKVALQAEIANKSGYLATQLENVSVIEREVTALETKLSDKNTQITTLQALV